MNPDSTLPETTPRFNRLDLPKTIKLIDWIREHEAAAMEHPDAQLAARAEAELGFKITPANFTSSREGVGIHKTRPPEPPTEMEALTARVTALEARVEEWIRDHGPQPDFKPAEGDELIESELFTGKK